MTAALPHHIGVKICGINSPEAFDAAADAGADWVGFVFFPPSPRCVSPAQAAALSGRREGGPRRVGLFVEPTDEALASALDAVQLDALQLYAPVGRVREVRHLFGVPVWRAVGVMTAGELPGAMDTADRLVIEPKPPAGATRPGGNAEMLDWTLMRRWDPPGSWLLAGGLTPDNVGMAIQRSGAEAVDVSSGVEHRPGVKEPSLIRLFVQSARGAVAGPIA